MTQKVLLQWPITPDMLQQLKLLSRDCNKMTGTLFDSYLLSVDQYRSLYVLLHKDRLVFHVEIS